MCKEDPNSSSFFSSNINFGKKDDIHRKHIILYLLKECEMIEPVEWNLVNEFPNMEMIEDIRNQNSMLEDEWFEDLTGEE